jgi:hypothetical protein
VSSSFGGARAEAAARLGGRYDVRVLEPSPPASTEAPFFADDPVLDASGDRGLPVVSAVANGDLRWSEVAAGDSELAAFCEERWLGPYRRLGPAPAGLEATRLALHAVAEHVIAPARRRANTKFGLRYTRGGFGTPFFGPDAQVRVQAGELTVVEAGAERSAPLTTLADAVELLGPELAAEDAPAGDRSALAVDAPAAALLGDWFGFGASVLEELRIEAGGTHDPSRVQLWPEHFDIALELGVQDGGGRANYGFSPGDSDHPEPYAYVGPWTPPSGELWNATGFAGAELSYSELIKAPDQREAALAFMRTRFAALIG